MCNRYGHWASVAALRQLAKTMGHELFTTSATDNLAPQKNIYPDQDAPIIRAHPDGLELAMVRWGLPPFSEFNAQGKRQTPRTNIRKTDHWLSQHHDRITLAEHRCLVPFSAFAEPVRDSTWFAVPGREVVFFAGICQTWSGERLKAQPGKTRRAREQDDWELYAFLTTEANSIVRPAHEKAMPVILHDPDECLEWLAGGEESLRLQRPLPDDQLQVVKPEQD